MAERQIKRNSRGQIVSYEIAAINDPTVATPEYGKFLLQGPNEEGTVIEKYSAGSFNDEINTDITLELVIPDTIIDTQIVLNEIITITDKRGVESVDPIGFAGTYIGQEEEIISADGQERTYVWDGTKWE
jgi:hypothetical protein